MKNTKNNMICFVRRSTIDYDIRLKKYVKACELKKTPFIAITWDRLKNSSPYNGDEYQFKVKAPYGGGLKSFIPLIGWAFFMYWNLIIHFKRYKTIHACNLEVFAMVFPFRIFGKKIVFDIYDSINPRIEKKLMKWADVLILPNEKRLEQIGMSSKEIGDKLLVVENVPDLDYRITNFAEDQQFSEKIKLSYVGTLERSIRGLETVVDIVKKDKRLYFDVAGVGSDMESFFEDCAQKCNRIKYHGQVKYEEGLSIMANSNFIIAIYRPSFPPYKYASPNKFHESLFLGKPVITSSGTLVGDQVKKNNTGYLTIENEQEIDFILKDAASDSFMNDYLAKVDNCKKLWNSTYKNYFTNIICGEYISKVLS